VFERATQRRAVPITGAELEACSVIIGAKRQISRSLRGRKSLLFTIDES